MDYMRECTCARVKRVEVGAQADVDDARRLREMRAPIG